MILQAQQGWWVHIDRQFVRYRTSALSGEGQKTDFNVVHHHRSLKPITTQQHIDGGLQ